MNTLSRGLVALTIVSAALFSFTRGNYAGSITGTVVPAEGASKVWALSGTDTLQSNVQSGSFQIINARPGTYRIIVEAKPPYKNTAKDNVAVTDGAPTNVGEIKLGQ